MRNPLNGNYIKLTEAAKMLGKPYGYLYFNYKNWAPVLGIIYDKGHYYCDKEKVQDVADVIKDGYVPAWKYRENISPAELLSMQDNTILFGVLWIKVNTDNYGKAKNP